MGAGRVTGSTDDPFIGQPMTIDYISLSLGGGGSRRDLAMWFTRCGCDDVIRGITTIGPLYTGG